MLRVVFTTLAFLGAFFQMIVSKTPQEQSFLFTFTLFNLDYKGCLE